MANSGNLAQTIERAVAALQVQSTQTATYSHATLASVRCLHLTSYPKYDVRLGGVITNEYMEEN